MTDDTSTGAPMPSGPQRPPQRPRRLDRRSFLLAAGAGLLAACSGGTSGGPASDDVAAPASPPPSTDPSPRPASTPSPTPTASVDPAEIAGRSPDSSAFPTGIVPARVEIPAIAVDTRCVEVNLTADVVEVPDFGLAGWWVQTRRPGEIGPAVIGGHVDTTSGPDVFFRLKELRVGDEVTVRDEEGATRTFVVDRDPIQVKKDERPPEVFGFGENRPELRLITCGGDFNPNIGHYVDNIVVFASDPTYDV